MPSNHPLHKILFAAAALFITLTVILANRVEKPKEISVFSELPTVVLDAGHGGEDGGASSADGLLEKDLNLSVTLKLADLLRSEGINVILTRSEDKLLYDRNSDYKSHKKLLDMQARINISDSAGDCIFVSIHMNSFPSVKSCKGIQIWYSPNNPDSQLLAVSLQTSAKVFQPSNTRAIKQAGTNIYLLNHLTVPAVLCECGFLSNPEEASKLSDDTYQSELAETLKTGILAYLNTDKAE